MMDIEGHSAPEVSEALGVPLNTVYSRLRVAREEFTAAVRRRTSLGGVR
jgi:RNA polymerase sigma-70 factor (ECF subfamily)